MRQAWLFAIHCWALCGCGGGSIDTDAGTVDLDASGHVPADGAARSDAAQAADATVAQDAPSARDAAHVLDASSGSDAASDEDAPDTGVERGDADVDACVRPSLEAEVLGSACSPSTDPCASGYTCQPFAGFVLSFSCEILCAFDCDCPSGTTCVDVRDKGSAWRQCEPSDG